MHAQVYQQDKFLGMALCFYNYTDFEKLPAVGGSISLCCRVLTKTNSWAATRRVTFLDL